MPIYPNGEFPDYKRFFEAIPGLHLVLSPDWYILAASDAYLKATLTIREEITGKYLFDVFPDNPDDPETKAVSNMKASLRRVAINKKPDSYGIQRHDVRVSEEEGGGFIEKVWKPVNTPILDSKGQIEYILHTVEDVTAYTHLQDKGIEELEKYTYHLELVNQKLAAANRELEQFAYVASHDLLEPLRTITSYILLLKKKYSDNLDHTAKVYFDFVVNASERLKILIKDLLDFSRIGRNLNIEDVNLNEILMEIIAEMESSLIESGAQIIAPVLPVIKGNSTELKLLFQNLISNAIKYRRKDVKPEIKINIEESPLEYFFSIQDNGIGIEEKYREKIFQVFQRLHSEKEYPGTGIGLAASKKIVMQYNGKIWVDSKPGEGSIFYFTLRKD